MFKHTIYQNTLFFVKLQYIMRFFEYLKATQCWQLTCWSMRPIWIWTAKYRTYNSGFALLYSQEIAFWLCASCGGYNSSDLIWQYFPYWFRHCDCKICERRHFGGFIKNHCIVNIACVLRTVLRQTYCNPLSVIFCLTVWYWWYKNIVSHTAHTIVSWPNPKQWLMIHTSDLMMIIR